MTEKEDDVIQDLVENYATDGFEDIIATRDEKGKWTLHLYTWDGHVFDITINTISKRRKQ